MGVTGLWRLIEPAGKPVPVETLENKVLAVDISIWLHQIVKGYQDAKGAPLPNAHLMGLFQRVCKLLYFRIKPIFVFDGAFPDLKKETIAKRQQNKSKYNSESERLKRELAILLGKKTVIGALLGKQISPKKAVNEDPNDDLFKLPALPEKLEETESESEEESANNSMIDLHSVDVESEEFKNMPIKEKYDLLLDLKETRKMNSWGKLHELPKRSDSFSDFQMQRLLKRRKVQACLEETEREMGESGMSLNDLETLLNEEGINTKIDSLPTRRIASSETTRYLLISNVKEALENAKKRKEAEDQGSTSTADDVAPASDNISTKKELPSKADMELDDDLQKAIQMSLECADEPNTSIGTSKTDDSWTSMVTDSDSTSASESDGYEHPDVSSAKAYIMQYSDFTNRAIDKIVKTKTKSRRNKCKLTNVDEIIKDLNVEKSARKENIVISSDDDDITVHRSNNDNDLQSEQNRPSSVTQNQVPLICKDNPLNTCLNDTQESVLCVENSVEEIVSLDSSECESQNKSDLIDLAQDEPLQIDDAKSKNIADTQENVMSSLSVNSSVDADTDRLTSVTKSPPPESSDDSDFEEVPLDNINKKAVVELTLNMEIPLDNDIFADIFETQNERLPTDVKLQVVQSVETSKIKIAENENEGFQNNLLIENQKTHNNTIVENIVFNSKLSKDVESVHCDKAGSPNPPDKLPVSPPKSPVTAPVLTDIIQSSNNKIIADTGSETILNTEKLNIAVEQLEEEETVLLQQKGRLDRMGRNITQQITEEAQELLQLFGIPYIVAPAEAEAQCAFLETVKLTDGTITDDSDIWLFGGRTVYKNFFNQKKHVLQFVSERIEKSYNLSREHLILLALLVGSDYTTGITGVGPVTALEILATFPYSKQKLCTETSRQGRLVQLITGLQEFKRWVKAGKRTDNISLKKKLKNVEVTDDFPSMRVVQAYLEPNIEKSEEKFTWGKLDITILRDYTKSKFGWSQNKVDEILKPVLKRIQESKTQKTVHDYFQKKISIVSLEDQMSKRVKAAVQKMGPEGAKEDVNAKEPKDSKEKNSRKRKQKLIGKDDVPKSSKRKVKKDDVHIDNKVVIMSGAEPGTSSSIDISIPKLDRYQEIIPQREKDKQSLLQNKLKAIEVFRKKQLDVRLKPRKRKVIAPRPDAELSEDSD